MKFFKIFKTGLRKIDLFGSNEYLRFKGDGKYQTLTGGVVTLILIILFSIVFLQSLNSVVHKDTVTSNDAIYYLTDPTYASFKISDSMFIFGIGITKYNLNDKFRYFDFTMTTQIFSNGEFKDQIVHSFQPCQQSQWAKVNELGKESYRKLPLDDFLCPSSNLTIQMAGKFTSDTFKLLRIKVSKCKNSTDESRPCVSQDQLKDIPYFNLNFYFMNPFVNSGNLEPVDYYLEDRNYFPFTLSSTLVNNIYLSEHIINTDVSLLPNEQVEKTTILLVKDLAESKSSLSVPDEYLNIYLRKSPQYMVSTRSFQKLDSLFSYIGGLFGFAIAFFFILNFYTEASYEVDMSSKLFYFDSSFPLQQSKFNILTFLALSLYTFLKFFGLQVPWLKMQQLYQCKEQVSEQLDLNVFMNKITFLEKCMNVLLEEHQFRAIYMQKKPTVEQAKNLRLNEGLNKIVHVNSKRVSKLQSKVSIDIYKESDEKILHKDTLSKQINLHEEYLQKMGDKISNVNSVVSQNIVEAIKEYAKTFDKKSEIQQLENNSSKSNKPEDISKGGSTDSEEQNVESLKYLNTVMNDIQLIQRQSKQGNRISHRIYERLNAEVIKERFLALKCMEKLSINIFGQEKKEQKSSTDTKIKKKETQEKERYVKRESSKSNSEKNKQIEDRVNHGLEIELETNDRIDRSYL